MARGEVELRCACSNHTLLGVGYRDPRTGEARLHIKIFKQSRVFGEVVITAGSAHIRCRDCLRYTKVTIKRVPILETAKPDEDVLSGVPQ